MYYWTCIDCGHEVLAKNRPEPIRWTDGHVCSSWHKTSEEEFDPANVEKDVSGIYRGKMRWSKTPEFKDV